MMVVVVVTAKAASAAACHDGSLGVYIQLVQRQVFGAGEAGEAVQDFDGVSGNGESS
jgi:hypothetical protein